MGYVVCGGVFDHYFLVGEGGVGAEGIQHFAVLEVIGRPAGDGAVTGCAAANFCIVQGAALDAGYVAGFGEGPGLDAPGAVVGQEDAVLRIAALVVHAGVGIDEREYLLVVLQTGNGHELAPEFSGIALGQGGLEVRLAYHDGLERGVVCAFPDVLVYDGLHVDV